MKTVLSMQSQVADAKVGNSAAVFVFERLGVQVIALPTVLFARRPDRGAPGGGVTPAAWLCDMLAQLQDAGRLAAVDVVLSGYLGAPEQAEAAALARALVQKANPAAVYVCDPVLGDQDRGLYAKPAVAQVIREVLAPAADLLTPNAFELAWLTGAAVGSVSEACAAAKGLGRAVLVTSAPSPRGLATLYCAPEQTLAVETPQLPGAPKGAGDVLTALFVAQRLRGAELGPALAHAVGAVFDLIVAAAGPNADLPLTARQDLLDAPRTRPQWRALATC